MPNKPRKINGDATYRKDVRELEPMLNKLKKDRQTLANTISNVLMLQKVLQGRNDDGIIEIKDGGFNKALESLKKMGFTKMYDNRSCYSKNDKGMIKVFDNGGGDDEDAADMYSYFEVICSLNEPANSPLATMRIKEDIDKAVGNMRTKSEYVQEIKAAVREMKGIKVINDSFYKLGDYYIMVNRHGYDVHTSLLHLLRI